jgi:hypothetical protein
VDDEFVEASVFASLSLHPSLAVEIERSIPIQEGECIKESTFTLEH